MSDTSPEIARLYREMLMAKSGPERMEMGSRSFDAARAMIIASLPEGLSEREIRQALLVRLYGNDLSPEMLKDVMKAL